MSQCLTTCKGFLSVRAECARDPCLSVGGTCRLLHPHVTDCAAWCCVNRGWYVFFMVLSFGIGTFALCAAFYLHRLHQMNVAAGAVSEEGEVVVIPAAVDEEPQVTRKKRVVQVDPKLLNDLQDSLAREIHSRSVVSYAAPTLFIAPSYYALCVNLFLIIIIIIIIIIICSS
eukprot:gene1272-730_t